MCSRAAAIDASESDMSSEVAIHSSADPVPVHVVRRQEPQQQTLPKVLSTFVGRECETEDIRDLLLDNPVRLVTVTGSGGVGKTRLSIRVAETISDAFADGVWFIALAAVADAKHVPSAISKVLGLRESGARPVKEDLINYLRRREALLLLDNFEHLLPASVFISELLASCPQIKLLVTSQQPLRITGEHDFSVAALNAPLRRFRGRRRSGPAEAVHLFEDRARAVRPDFRLTDDNIPIVEAICREVDGLPLAIELAAARIRFLSPEALLSRLLGDRRAQFQLLAGGPRDAPERHRSLRDTIAWSYRLLDQSEQQLFRRLAVFQGGFSLEAAESVCEFEPWPDTTGWRLGVFEGIASLVDKSLLIQREVDSPNPVIYMLTTVRAFATEELDRSDEELLVHARHANYYLDLAERAAPELSGPTQRQWLDRLTAEHDNVLAALTWFDQSGRDLELIRLTWALFFYWWYQGYTGEAKDWFDRALSHDLSQPNPLQAWVTFGAGIQASIGGDYQTAADLASRPPKRWPSPSWHTHIWPGEISLSRRRHRMRQSICCGPERTGSGWQMDWERRVFFWRGRAITSWVSKSWKKPCGSIRLGATTIWRGFARVILASSATTRD
jgi:predicted ATPase